MRQYWSLTSVVKFIPVRIKDMNKEGTRFGEAEKLRRKFRVGRLSDDCYNVGDSACCSSEEGSVRV